MFKDPQHHLIIGIVKTRTVEDSLGDREDILSVALGENDETVSFKGYKCIIVEQDNIEELQEMAKLIQESPCIKNFVKKGFIDQYELLKIFEKAKDNNQIK